MDLESISLGMMAAPLIAKATERASEKVVDTASQGLATFTGWLRQRLHGHPSATALAHVVEVPDSASLVRALADALDERAAADPGFAAELREHVEQARAAGVQVTSISQSAVGDANVQAANVQGSVSVTYGAQSGSAASRVNDQPDPSPAAGGQWARGNQNVQVQNVASGASVTVIFGGQRRQVPLRPAVVRPGRNVRSPARLMRASSGVLPFVDRDGLLAGLQAWMADPSPFSTYLVGGRGGCSYGCQVGLGVVVSVRMRW